MHRSRSSLLVILAAAAACSTSDASENTAILSQDTALVAQLEVRRPANQQPLPAACGTVAVAARPASASKAQAEKLARQAYDAELLGQLPEAKSLLLRAAALDGTDRTVAYHLARTSEALGDRANAMTGYCRFLALAPTSAESAEAVQRLAMLSQREVRTAAGSVNRGAPIVMAQRTTRRQPTQRTHVSRAARTAHERPARATSPDRGSQSTSVELGSADDMPMPSTPATTSAAADGSVDLPATPPPARRTASGGMSRVQGAGIGAVAGAMIGAATGRSVKSAVIGATAGGLLGTIVVGQGVRRSAQ